jgi:hypothetical protein
MEHLYLRTQFDDAPVALSARRFRKQILRYGEWSHPSAPGGKLRVTKELVAQIVANFHKGVRDNVPIPLGHEVDAISSVGQVVALDVDDTGLWGIHEIKDEAAAEKIGTTWTGSSAFIDLNAVDKETGEVLGPVLVHNAITNAPYIKNLAPFESVALGEDAQDAVVIQLQEATVATQGGRMTIEEMLAQLAETSDDELREALSTARPELFAVANGEAEVDEAAIEAARAEGREAVVAALAEKGITVGLSESAGDGAAPEVDITSAPEFVKLSERVTTLEGEKTLKAVTIKVDDAVKAGKVLPSQRDALIEVGLSDEEMLNKLIPAQAVVSLSEEGVNPADETNVQLSEEDAEAEANRLVAAYASNGKKE